MKNLLIMGISCRVYRKEPLIRLFFNQNFVDEFNVPHNTVFDDYQTQMKERIKKENKILDPVILSLYKTIIKEKKPFLPFTKIIEIEDFDKEYINLEIVVDAVDNNFTNGFMTKTTLIQFDYLYLIPYPIAQNLALIKKKYKFDRKKIKNINDIKKYYTKKTTTHVVLRNFAKNDYQAQDIQNMQGGKFNLKIKLFKKLNSFWCEQNDLSIGKRWIGEVDFLEFILDKYLQDENQRNFN